jgi:hypothetical protein
VICNKHETDWFVFYFPAFNIFSDVSPVEAPAFFQPVYAGGIDATPTDAPCGKFISSEEATVETRWERKIVLQTFFTRPCYG